MDWLKKCIYSISILIRLHMYVVIGQITEQQSITQCIYLPWLLRHFL